MKNVNIGIEQHYFDTISKVGIKTIPYKDLRIHLDGENFKIKDKETDTIFYSFQSLSGDALFMASVYLTNDAIYNLVSVLRKLLDKEDEIFLKERERYSEELIKSLY